jgi:hypothetical protein
MAKAARQEQRARQEKIKINTGGGRWSFIIKIKTKLFLKYRVVGKKEVISPTLTIKVTGFFTIQVLSLLKFQGRPG